VWELDWRRPCAEHVKGKGIRAGTLPKTAGKVPAQRRNVDWTLQELLGQSFEEISPADPESRHKNGVQARETGLAQNTVNRGWDLVQ
jgi:hypothetical protein